MTAERTLYSSDTLNERSFEALFRDHFPGLLGFARKILGSEDDARDVVHRVFVALWEKRREVDATVSLKSYLYTSVHNRSLNVIRDRKKFSDADLPEQADGWDASTHLESAELEEKIRAVIAALPEKCREVFEMNRFEGLKYAEIAETLGISVKTVENQMSKALKILREKLAAYLTILLWILMQGMN
ncbi:MAG: RNA polymerase sigma-70 factor [Bacteroidales bacterium]